MSNPLVPRNGNDKVFTPDYLAKAIIQHFNLKGFVLDPCKGKGAFYDNFPVRCTRDWCEIDEGRDFLTYDCGTVDWVVGNFPWSQIRAFHKRAMSISDNMISLCLTNALFMKARQRDMEEMGFGIKEILFVDTPPKPWPQTGFSLSANHLQRGWKGDIKISKLSSEKA
jgi:hypothetical protein